MHRLIAQLKDAWIVVHRYTSAALCLLFAVWFVSGVAMAYYRKPVLTESQRLAFAPPLNGAPSLRPERIPALVDGWPETEMLKLGRWQNRAIYRWRTASTGWHSAWADTGEAVSFDASLLEPEAKRWFGAASPIRYDGVYYAQSQWSYFAEVHEHYPLHRFSTTGLAPRQVLFSSRTGEPVVATTFATRALYYLGPGLHYFSFYPIRNNDRLWRGLVNWSSGIGAFTCFLGIIIGLWQFRWRAIGTDRRVIPYARRWMRWHHWTGLAFGLLTFTFVLSGLFSMNPGGMFALTTIPGPLDNAFHGLQPPLQELPMPAPNAEVSGRPAREIEWLRIRGRPYAVARHDLSAARLFSTGGPVSGRGSFSDDELLKTVADLLPAPVLSIDRLHEFDDHYYARKDRHLPLPVLRVRLADDRSTWYYVDPGTGQLFLKSDGGTRVRRWLYNGLHSFDMQLLLRRGRWWDATIWLLSLCGLALSLTGVVITWHWIQRSVTPALAQSGTRPSRSTRTDGFRPLSPFNEGEME